jgi:hypothetical protein
MWIAARVKRGRVFYLNGSGTSPNAFRRRIVGVMNSFMICANTLFPNSEFERPPPAGARTASCVVSVPVHIQSSRRVALHASPFQVWSSLSTSIYRAGRFQAVHPQ